MTHPIPVFREINALHAATGFDGRTDLPDFHIFRLEETYPSTRSVMASHQLDFFQLTLFENSGGSRLFHNAETLNDLNNLLAVASPDHVISWVRGKRLQGFAVLFKPMFLTHLSAPVFEEFPFFELTTINVLYLGTAEFIQIRDGLARLYTIFTGDHPYRVPLLQTELLNVLYRSRQFFDVRQAALESMPTAPALVYRFRQTINQHYLQQKQVASYAQWLGVSPDYLGKIVKQTTGKTALDLIHERVLLEAQRLLRHSQLTAAEIAAYLGFEESSHFGRFFRRSIGQSPIAWRESQVNGN